MNLEQNNGKKRKRLEGDDSESGQEEAEYATVGAIKDGQDVELRAILTHQLEFELALRKRVAKVIKARIAWAEQLKEAILRNQGTQTTSDPVKAKQQAMESFRALHAPLNLDSHTVHPRGSSIPYTPDSTPNPTSSTSKQLYFIPPTSSDTSFPPLLLLSCPYPSCPTPHPSATLQGLLNHARIAHGPSYAYASHDEFLRAPGSSTLLDAIKDPEQYARVMAEGVRVKLGSVRGLRELFEGALEGGGLGFSTETPELAGLLGRKARKGEIRAFGQDDVVDVESVDESGEERWRGYGMWAPKRGTRRVAVAEEVGSEEEESTHQSILVPGAEQPRAPSTPQNAQSSSRFHIKKRVVVSDWSRSLRRADVQPDGPTHRWMIRLTAPSYSDHITTFLSSVRVQCASIPPVFEDTITCSAPPFAISRLSKGPFLARITLVFADERTKDVVITHWVDLDPMRSGNTALGAEQIFDVELDRNAQLLPADTSMDNTPNSVLWSEDRGSSDKVAKREEDEPHAATEGPGAGMVIKSEPQEEDGYLAEAPTDESVEDQVEPLHERLVPILSKLRARLPLTVEDTKTGSTPTVPYTLFDTRSELLDAAHGRRKAVEWLYTRTMLDMLKAEYSTYDADLDSKLVEDLGVSRLYTYLAAEKVFPRPEIAVSSVMVEEIAAEEQPEAPMGALTRPTRYCGSCGLDVLRHPQTSRVLEHSGFTCLGPGSSQRPTCDIGLWTLLRPVREHIQRVNLTPGAITTQGTRASLRGASQLVECANPQITLAFHALTQSWGLKTFEYSAKRRNPANSLGLARVVETKLPLELLGVDASHVDRTLAPHALLTLISEVFIKRLVREAVRARAEMLQGSHVVGPSVLTAAHVSRALMDGRNSEGWLPLMAVARIGILHMDSILG